MVKRIAILGSTGSIGVNTLDVLSRFKDRFEIAALSADSNVELLARQMRLFSPKMVSIGTKDSAAKLKSIVSGKTKILCCIEGLREIASSPDIDIVVFAISGASCLVPLLDAVKTKKKIALANKEAMVSAGSIIMAEAKSSGAVIIPVDSEHSAIFQCLDGKRDFLSRIYLTGSGGPLLGIKASKFNKLSRSFILKHPRWKMGRKISVDSATMMNKGLEIIEAKHLFGVEEETIKVLIHPEAVIHSMVELVDGTIFAQLGVPDMRIPIQYALTHPDRMPSGSKKLNFSVLKQLTFMEPDIKRFPCLELARRAARLGGAYPAILCASDEEAVKSYLDSRISFSDIPSMIGKVMSRYKNIKKGELAVSEILEADGWAREETESLCYH